MLILVELSIHKLAIQNPIGEAQSEGSAPLQGLESSEFPAGEITQVRNTRIFLVGPKICCESSYI